MKKILSFLTILLITASYSYAQETISLSDSLSGWNYSWIAGLNGSQASYSNWSQGGVNTISVLANSRFSTKYREERYGYGFLINTRYGRSRIEDQGTRKTDDKLSVRNRFLYDLSERGDYSLFGNVNFRTQFDDGYEYGAGPDGGDVLISGFMAPAYFMQSAGLAYTPSDYFSFEAGLAMKQTIVTDEDLQTLYGLDEGQTLRNEAGVVLGAAYEQSIASDILWSASVETFTNVSRAVSSTDINFSSELTARVNDIISTSLRVDLAYDDDFSEELQVQQVLSLGVSFMLM